MTRLATIACLVVSACGFMPQDDFTGQRAGDGIAPWTDLGPVQICFGNEFIGPPATDPGGMCAPSTVVEPPCTEDTDCQSRETCVCGRCTVQYCTVNSDCAGDRVCSFAEKRCDRICARDDDCAVTDVCFNGSCRGRCLVDLDCQTGEVCDSQNRCITVSCGDTGDCLAGERCRVQRIPRLALEPSVLPRIRDGEPRFTMWLEMADELQLDSRAIWRATSPDGVHFNVDPARAIVEDVTAAHAPSVIRTEAGFVLYYESGDGAEIRTATSVDGIAFGAATTAVTGGPGSTAARAPSAVQLPDGDVALYYQVGDGSAIALAVGPATGPLAGQGQVLRPADVEDAPASGPNPQFWVEVTSLRSPFAAITSGADGTQSLRLWYSAFGRESGDSEQFGETIPIPPNFSVGYAGGDITAPDRLQPWPFNPVLDRVTGFVDHRSELTPSVVQIPDAGGAPTTGYLMYYLDAETDTDVGPFTFGRIGVAGNGELGSRLD